MYDVSDIIPAHNSCFSPPNIFRIIYSPYRVNGEFFFLFSFARHRGRFLCSFSLFVFVFEGLKCNEFMHFPVQRVLAPRQEEQQQQRARNIFGRPTPLGGPTFSWTRSHKNQTQYIPTYTHTHTEVFSSSSSNSLQQKTHRFFFSMCVCFISFTTESFISFFYLSPPKIKIRGGFAAPSM
jgi:hypothetical protein